ncbi:MAG: hypothetical protein DHS20C01_10420 [marine bacterium B5-7]|nr:MAG: hypothetical protein DHS20C01_10420 [marine bacterium B5-7]
MITINQQQYSAFVSSARVIQQSREFGANVWLTADDRIIKAFHRQRGFIANRLWSYARRFTSHASRLERRGIRSVKVEEMYRCPEVGSELVIYKRLPGKSLRELEPNSNEESQAFDALPGYLAKLHCHGIHFRGIHLGNILYDGETGFALIDVGFMRFYPWPLGIIERATAFRKILAYPEDRERIVRVGLQPFMQGYVDAAGLSVHRARRFMERCESNTLPANSQNHNNDSEKRYG